MNYLVIPVICSLVLASMSAAVVSHWWSLEMFTSIVRTMPGLLPSAPAGAPSSLSRQPPLVPQLPAAATSPAQVALPAPAQREFFEALLDEMKQIRRENTALRDQMAENNRDLMKLEFRVDTHSASFRPLPTSESEPALDAPVIDSGTGVLPPQPEVADLPGLE